MSKQLDLENFYLNFLKNNQPLPNDSKLSESLIKKYDEARKFFQINYNENCVPLFLNSFGGMNGLGVYQLIEETILNYPKEIVIPQLRKNIGCSTKPIAYWNMQIASHYNDIEFLKPLRKQLFHKDFDLSFAALLALSEQNKADRKKMIQEFLTLTKEPDLILLAKDI